MSTSLVGRVLRGAVVPMTRDQISSTSFVFCALSSPKNKIMLLFINCKAFDTEMCFLGPVYRERLHAIDFLAFYCFRREPPPMEDFFFPSKWGHSYLIIRFSQLSFVILMYTSINLGMAILMC